MTTRKKAVCVALALLVGALTFYVAFTERQKVNDRFAEIDRHIAQASR